MRPEDQRRIVSEVTGRVHSEIVRRGDVHLEEILIDCVYYERSRVESERPSPEREVELDFWKHVQHELLHGSTSSQRTILHEIVRRHAEEVVGNFSQTVYDVTSRVLPRALNFLLNAPNPRRVLRNFPRLPSLEDTVIVQGQTQALKRLAKRGTVVLVPTHFSHLDSIVVGYALQHLDLPPFAYGAGLNLFNNPIMSYFMHNLGAYKVDRKKKHQVYKNVLKTYCTVSLEMGYHNLFFPGGTRSRSGAVESKLKKGLLGCGLSAYIQSLAKGGQGKDVFIVPANISFQLVLEAETLIEDFLAEQGKSRFIIEDDAFWEPTRVAQFLFQLASLDSKIYVSFGQAYDPFGNKVDEDGISRDGRGRAIDKRHYVLRDGVPGEEGARDREYTKELADRLTEEMHRLNVIQSTHLLARAVWSLLLQANAGMDLYRLLRTGGRVMSFAVEDVEQALSQLLDSVCDLSDAGRILIDGKVVARGNAGRVLSDALSHLGTFHLETPVSRDGDRIIPGNMNLIYYYQHRLDGYGLKA